MAGGLSGPARPVTRIDAARCAAGARRGAAGCGGVRRGRGAAAVEAKRALLRHDPTTGPADAA